MMSAGGTGTATVTHPVSETSAGAGKQASRRCRTVNAKQNILVQGEQTRDGDLERD